MSSFPLPHDRVVACGTAETAFQTRRETAPEQGADCFRMYPPAEALSPNIGEMGFRTIPTFTDTCIELAPT